VCRKFLSSALTDPKAVPFSYDMTDRTKRPIKATAQPLVVSSI
jgi:hypothetical protein